jgi:sugar/nucleoside kinase (ribokinase family)
MSEATTSFIAVGDWMSDIVATLPGPLRSGTDTPADVRVLGGGAAANVAAWLGHDGHDTTFVGRIGDDLLGRAGTAELERWGVRCAVAIDPRRPSGTCIVLVTPDGQRTMVPSGGANQGLTPQDIDDAIFRPGAHVYLSGYTLLGDGSRMAGLSVLDRARLRGLRTSVDVASAGPISDAGPARFLSWVSGVDVLFANESEAALLAGLPEPDLRHAPSALEAAYLAGTVLARSVGAVVVKLGPLGAVLIRADGSTAHADAVPADVVDTTGAGDAFAAGFLQAWTARHDGRAALEAGARSAARVVTRVGARP